MRQEATGREVYRFLEDLDRSGGGACNDGVVKIYDGEGTKLLDLDQMYELADLGGCVDYGAEDDEILAAFNVWAQRVKLEDPRRLGPKYPNTFAADLVCMLGPPDPDRPTHQLLSRVGAAFLLGGLAKVLKIPGPELAEKLADFYLEHEQELLDAGVERIRALRGGG